jgi:hypothetical protein
MDDKIIATFCLCDDLLKAMHHQEDRQCQMNDAEIMTTAFVASLFFRGNHESARTMLKQHGYIPHMVSKSRFSRRLHRIKEIFIIIIQSFRSDMENAQYRRYLLTVRPNLEVNPRLCFHHHTLFFC